MEGVEARERLVRIESRWGHEMSDFKKLWYFNMDHEIADACQFRCDYHDGINVIARLPGI
jgi:hypothetical protein